MTHKEALLDAFDRADGAQEIAFRNYQRAERKNVGALMLAAIKQGRQAHGDIAQLAKKLSRA